MENDSKIEQRTRRRRRGREQDLGHSVARCGLERAVYAALVYVRHAQERKHLTQLPGIGVRKRRQY